MTAPLAVVPHGDEPVVADLVDALRRGVPPMARPRRAAVELIVWHNHWGTDHEFVRRFVHRVSEETAEIRWAALDEALERDDVQGDDDHVAVLRLACALAMDTFSLTRQDAYTSRLVVRTVGRALGLSS